MKKNLNAQLKALAALKDLPEFGGRSVEFLAAEEMKLMEAIGHTPSATPAKYGVRDYLQYYRFTIGPVMARSLAGAFMGIVVLLGGWLTTVSAASDSLPGDPLYGLKLITEQVQLRVSSLEQRAVLHTEFAERRLNEAVALQKASGDADAVRAALDGFTREVSSANSDLQALQLMGGADAVAAAGKVEERLAALDDVLDQSVGGDDATTATKEAKDISREAQTTAVAVVVGTHESGDTAAAAAELQQMFMRQLGDLKARHAFDLHRIDTIKRAIASGDPRLDGLDAAALPSSAELGMTLKIIMGEETRLKDALAVYSAGDYRGAFDLLRSIDGALRQEEELMAQVEIAITQAFAQPAIVETSGSGVSEEEEPDAEGSHPEEETADEGPLEDDGEQETFTSQE